MAGRRIENGLIPWPDPGGEPPGQGVGRRGWLQMTAGAVAGWCAFEWRPGSGVAADDSKPAGAGQADDDLKRAEAQIRKVTSVPLRVVRSRHYQAIGDASERFVKLAVDDCELIALDYLDHYRAKGFDVKLPDRRLTLIVFYDQRQFARFLPGVSRQVSGIYRGSDNWLVVYDSRNVPMLEGKRPAGYINLMNLAHEATHQLTFNTGLLNRRGDVPRSITEGLGMYSESRRLGGRSEPGQINSLRLEHLAGLLQQKKWITATDLLTDDKEAFGTNLGQVLLAYAQSWLLVYYLMTEPSRLPQFRAYLKTIYGRTDKAHRLDDAQAHFGDLVRLDRELLREEIRLQQAR
jgi:hypothetical protein